MVGCVSASRNQTAKAEPLYIQTITTATTISKTTASVEDHASSRE
jgi:hypothetical protein